MAQDISIEARRFKQVREDQGKTQSEFASMLDAGSTTADIERGKKKITGKIVSELLRQFNINPLWLYGNSYNKELETSPNTAPKIITMDSTDRENMIMVPIKASAGYASNVQDTDWYQELPAFNIPLPQYKEGSYRAFQVKGDSMLPVLQPEEWVMAKAVESIRQANQSRIHVVVTDDTVVVKKLVKQDGSDQVSLISLNKDYPVIEQPIVDIKELWEVNSKLSFDLDVHEGQEAMLSLKKGLDSLRDEIAGIKKGT
ncbi:LexA family transcriptional regulator [Nonlabens ponticola]|uniref:XRE family transcriptional regulator n=1 Tax=Nonlabens ponticola TaxID=2496866 RepID=A0A3S9MUV8_9FLAO|nr:XRE family transcriptional regulator [Nonlabens ponticola]AZQ42965.1 XRE family transcriptional regulator [Nonlabens ponticola]